jgi:hypothetical protein
MEPSTFRGLGNQQFVFTYVCAKRGKNQFLGSITNLKLTICCDSRVKTNSKGQTNRFHMHLIQLAIPTPKKEAKKTRNGMQEKNSSMQIYQDNIPHNQFK